jgi:hypothetical protein
MSFLQNTLRLAKYEFDRYWVNYLWTGIYAIFIGLMNVFLLHFSSIEAETPNEEWVLKFSLNLYFLFAMAVLGGKMNSPSGFKAISKRISFLKRLPIIDRELVISQLLLTVGILLVNCLLCFTLIWWFAPELREQLQGESYFWFAFFWIGYFLIWAGWFPYCELANHTSFTVWAWVAFFFLLSTGVSILLAFLKVNVVQWSIDLILHYGAAASAVSLAIGAAAALLWSRAAEIRLRKMDLS